jgi:hypothetical protein
MIMLSNENTLKISDTQAKIAEIAAKIRREDEKVERDQNRLDADCIHEESATDRPHLPAPTFGPAFVPIGLIS